jgi:hypothetical protein
VAAGIGRPRAMALMCVTRRVVAEDTPAEVPRETSLSSAWMLTRGPRVLSLAALLSGECEVVEIVVVRQTGGHYTTGQFSKSLLLRIG